MTSVLLVLAIELARVNGDVITDADLKAAFVSKHGGHTTFLGGDVETRRFLDIVINERLLIQEAWNLGLENDPTVKRPVDAFRDQKATEHLLRVEVEEKAVATTEEIRAAWEEARHLHLAREIVLDTRQEADEVRRALVSGADFEEMARSCSLAPTRSRGGNLAPFTWGSLTAEIEGVARSLEPGLFSDVFHTADGWRILYLIDRADAVHPSLDQKVSQRIAAKLKERKRQTLSDEFAAALISKYAATIALQDRSPAALARLLKETPDAVVATWTGGNITARETFTPAEVKMYAAFRPGRATDRIESNLQAVINTALVKLEARARRIHELPQIAKEITRYQDRLMESALYTKHVLTDVKVTDEDVRAEWEKRKDQFTVAERRRISHIAVATEGEARQLLDRIRKGEEWLELLATHTLDKPSIKTRGDLGWIEKGKVAETYDALFTLPKDGVAPPLQGPAGWHLLRVTAIEAEHVLSFDEAKEKVRTNLIERKKHEAREFWIKKLRKAGEIEILDQGLKAFVKANPYVDPKEQGEPK